MTIRAVHRNDYLQWLPLSEGYNAFYGRANETALPDEITRTTWERFFDAYEPVFAMVAESDGKLIGLVHYLVVAAIEHMRARGIEELSLNFAALTKTIRDPENVFERVLGRTASALDKYLQIESLYRFNVKFQPRWEPRYLVYEGRLGLVRAAVAAMWAEGQMPKPKVPRLKARSGQRTLKTLNR